MQHSLVGSLNSVVSTVAFHSVDDEKTSTSTGLTEVPEHLQNLIEGTSDNLTNEQQESLKQLIVENQDIFVGSDGKLWRTDLAKHNRYWNCKAHKGTSKKSTSETKTTY